MAEIVSFGEWIQVRRNQLGLTRSGLARQVGCSPVTIKKIERDERRPSVQIAELLAQHLLIPPTEQADFIRRARGEFVADMDDPTSIPFDLPVEIFRYTLDLPAQSTSFIGRNVEMAKVEDLLTRPEVRLVTILAEGGMGKTRLAMEIVQSLEKAFINGAIFVPLAPVDSATFGDSLDPISATIANQLNYIFQGKDRPRDQLFDALFNQELLLVLDNFEHLIEYAVVVDELLAVVPHIKVLVTSRESLNLQAEWVVALTGMPLDTAVSVFTQRAQQVKHDFDLLPDLEYIQQICQLVDGMPLGLELAAAWVRLMPCSKIVTEIEKSIDFLVSRMRDLPDRHRSLRAVFESSWQLLTETEQVELAKLAVFRGGFDDRAATAVTGASLWSLANLVDKSLLKVQGGRYEIHERLRQFAEEKLHQFKGAYEQVRTQHARTYFEMMSQQAVKLHNQHIKEALSKLSLELDNLRAATRWALQQKWFPELIQAWQNMWPFYDVKGLSNELIDIFEPMVGELQTLCSMGASSADKPYNLWLSQSLIVLISCQVRSGLSEAGARIMDEAIPLLRSVQPAFSEEVATYLIYAGNAMSQAGMSQGTALILEGLFNDQGCSNPQVSALGLLVVGMDYFFSGQYDEAERYLKASQELLSTGETMITSYIFSTLGRMAAAKGQYPEAEALFERSMEIRRIINDQAGMAFSHRDLGDIAQLQGDLVRAQMQYEQGLALCERIGLGQVTVQLWWGLGNVALRQRAYHKAQKLFHRSQTKTTKFSSGGSVIANPGWGDLGLGQMESARTTFREMLTEATEQQKAYFALEAITGFAYLYAQNGDYKHAVEWLTLVLQHSMTFQDTRERAQKLWEEFQAELSTNIITEAEARGRELDLWQTAEALLTEGIDS